MYYMAKKDVSEAVCSVSEAADSFVTVARSSAKFHSSLVFQGAKEIGTPPCFQMAEAENICNVQRLIGISNGPYNCVQSLLEPTSPHIHGDDGYKYARIPCDSYYAIPGTPLDGIKNIFIIHMDV